MQAAQRGARVAAARRGQEFLRGGQDGAPGEPLLDLGLRGGRRETGRAVEEGVGALVREVADGGGVEAALSEPRA